MKKQLRKQLVVLGSAAALLLSAVPAYADPVSTATPPSEQLEAQHEQERSHWRFSHHGKGDHGANHEARKLKHLNEAAAYFGIKTEGKSTEQIIKELKAAREADPAKWDKFKTEMKAKRLTHLQEVAKGLGIKTEGKTAHQLREEIRAKCKDSAKKNSGKGESSAPSTQAPSKQ
ncbi:hypothetical protein A8990_11252 [Paenibacillus taihuensis]|uniref:Uncharacterized protein n=1 Tax=Paenibacillus taihuensis TaxID=1156355 RepID=A0A3D9S0M1_9BACL|nr:hypothetical protein [Paenibacillus taihuensis]REE85323.1 hypothetical protein A8990_11252 [Paenibacillus taihuensis]